MKRRSRTTLVGSMMHLATRSQYSSVWRQKPKSETGFQELSATTGHNAGIFGDLADRRPAAHWHDLNAGLCRHSDSRFPGLGGVKEERHRSPVTMPFFDRGAGGIERVIARSGATSPQLRSHHRRG